MFLETIPKGRQSIWHNNWNKDRARSRKDASELTPESEAGQEDLGYSALPSDAYEEEEWETQKQKVWPHQIHVFGMRQNQINRRYSAWIRTLEIQNRALEIRVQRLEEELAEQKKELERQKKKRSGEPRQNGAGY